MSISLSVKDHAFSRAAQPGGAYYPVARQDWGVLAPGATGTAFGNGNLTNVGSGGSLANGNFFAKITWVTALGETTPSAEGTVTVTGGPSGSVTIALGSTGSLNTGAQLNAQPIIGWRIYTSSTTGTELANEAAASLSVSMLSITPKRGGTLLYIPIATTSATVKVLGAGAALPVVNTSGVQDALPAITTNVTADINVRVPVPFNPNKITLYTRPNATADASGISLDAVDCVAPIWPQSTAVTQNTSYVVIQNVLWQCIVSGTTGSSVPNFAGTTTQYATLADNTATWQNLGRFHLLTLRFANLSGSTAQPTANEYDFFQP
ncbi:MAG TPA: hypothetical protein VHW72_02795 [Candidatus Angelobacter sp.]|nr:hypothetical protein [Candidatus Angelobacter sp.]